MNLNKKVYLEISVAIFLILFIYRRKGDLKIQIHKFYIIWRNIGLEFHTISFFSTCQGPTFRDEQLQEGARGGGGRTWEILGA
jgi:hypothetical protein